MTEDQIREYLKSRGCPETVWRGGSERLLRDWERFVLNVESGYGKNWFIEDYWNDLDTRELIHDIGCDDNVADLDRRFAAMLTATNVKHWHKDRDSHYDFWNYGYPNNAAGHFYEDVKRYILRQP